MKYFPIKNYQYKCSLTAISTQLFNFFYSGKIILNQSNFRITSPKLLMKDQHLISAFKLLSLLITQIISITFISFDFYFLKIRGRMKLKVNTHDKYYKWLEILIKCRQVVMKSKTSTKTRLSLMQPTLSIEFFNVTKHN